MSKFPNIMQPQDSNMCGAYSLVAALHYLGCFSNISTVSINKLNIVDETFTGQDYSVKSEQPLDQIAALFYRVTGVIPEGNTAEYEYSNNALNSLVAMAYIASRYSLKVSIIIRDEATKTELKKLYPQEMRLAEVSGVETVFLENCIANHENEVVLPTIVVRPGQHHIVALDHHNHCFDPARGQTSMPGTPSDPNISWLGVGLCLEQLT